MEKTDHRRIFNWQEGDSFDAFVSPCPWCETATAGMRGSEDDDNTTDRRCECPLCGWFSSRYIWMSGSTGMFNGSYHNAILKRFPRSRRVEAAARAVTVRLRTVLAGARSKGWPTLKAAAQEELRDRKYKIVLAVIAENGDAMIVATPGREIFMFELTGLQTPDSLNVILPRHSTSECLRPSMTRS